MHNFITGGAGFIGSHIVESLLISGHRITILDDLSSGVRGNVPNHPRIAFIEKNLLSHAATEWPRDLNGRDPPGGFTLRRGIMDRVTKSARN